MTSLRIQNGNEPTFAIMLNRTAEVREEATALAENSRFVEALNRCHARFEFFRFPHASDLRDKDRLVLHKILQQETKGRHLYSVGQTIVQLQFGTKRRASCVDLRRHAGFSTPFRNPVNDRFSRPGSSSLRRPLVERFVRLRTLSGIQISSVASRVGAGQLNRLSRRRIENRDLLWRTAL
jgi:hypothetical protein